MGSRTSKDVAPKKKEKKNVSTTRPTRVDDDDERSGAVGNARLGDISIILLSLSTLHVLSILRVSNR